MKKYLTLIYLCLSIMSFAQFKDNVFDHKSSNTEQQSAQGMSATTAQGESVQAFDPNEPSDDPGQSLGPGNPGDPAPIDDYIPFLLLGGLVLVFYYQIKRRKINI